MNGVGKRHTGRTIQLAVDETTKDIVGIEVRTADWGDSEVSVNGAYDPRLPYCHGQPRNRGASAGQYLGTVIATAREGLQRHAFLAIRAAA